MIDLSSILSHSYGVTTLQKTIAMEHVQAVARNLIKSFQIISPIV